MGFAYPGARRAAHSGLLFAIAAGERIGIAGPSGARKSSIVLLLLGEVAPQPQISHARWSLVCLTL